MREAVSNYQNQHLTAVLDNLDNKDYWLFMVEAVCGVEICRYQGAI